MGSDVKRYYSDENGNVYDANYDVVMISEDIADRLNTLESQRDRLSEFAYRLESELLANTRKPASAVTIQNAAPELTIEEVATRIICSMMETSVPVSGIRAHEYPKFAVQLARELLEEARK